MKYKAIRTSCIWQLKLAMRSKLCVYCVATIRLICYSYTIALSGLFELYVRGGCLNHEAKPSGLNMCLERAIQ